MKKEKLHIVIVENLEYWLTNETSDWRVKEYIVRAPSRETAVKLTKERLYRYCPWMRGMAAS